MGTRHLVAVQIDGDYKVAQYGQWDGYPDGQGVRVLDFLRNGNIEGLKANLNRTFEPTEEDNRRMWAEFGVDIVASNGMVPYDRSNEFAARYPTIHRNTGAGILELIAEAEGGDKIPLRLNIEFAADSLFCEWAYVIDFDINTFEVYKGFNKAPVPADSRFAHLAYDDEQSGRDTYYQVALAQSWKLEALPSKEEFLAAFAEPNENKELEDGAPNADEGVAASVSDVGDTDEGDRPIWSA